MDSEVEHINSNYGETKAQYLAFISDDIVRLYQYDETSALEYAYTKDDFDCKIINAALLNRHATTLHQNTTIKLENHDFTTRKEEQLIQNRSVSDALILVLDSFEIIILNFLLQNPSEVILKYDTLPVFASINPLNRLGRVLAVDERSSNTIAIASCDGGLTVYASQNGFTNRPEQLQLEVKQWSKKIDGRILQMAFMHMPEESVLSFMLVLLSFTENKVILEGIEWTRDDDHSSAKLHKQPINLGKSMPELLIPLASPVVFLVATCDSIFLFQNFICGVAEQINLVDALNPSDKALLSNGRAVWVDYAQVSPTTFLIFRSDGLVVEVRILCRNTKVVECHLSLRQRILSNVDHATVIRKIHDTEIDVIIANASGDSGIYRTSTISSSKVDPLEAIHRLPGWSLCRDLLCTKIPLSDKKPSRSHPAVCIASMGSETGTMTELRPGLKANLVASFAIDDFRILAVSRLLCIDSSAVDGTMLLFASGDGEEYNQILVCLDDEGVTIMDHSILDEGNPLRLNGVDQPFEAKSLLQNTVLAVNRVDNEGSRVYYATNRCVFLVENGKCRMIYEDCEKDTRIQFAEICSMPGKVVVGFCIGQPNRRDGEFRLVEFNDDKARLIHTSRLEECVTAMAMIVDQDEIVCILSFTDGLLKYINISKNDGYQIYNHRFQKEMEAEMIFNSMIIIKVRPPSTRAQFRLLCGMRNGQLMIIRTDIAESMVVSIEETRSLGTTDVTILRDSSQRLRQKECVHHMLVFCETDVFRVRISARPKHIPCEVRPVVICDGSNPAFQHSHIHAMVQIQHDAVFDGVNLLGCFVVVMGAQCMIVDMEQSNPPNQAIPRQIVAQCNPSRLSISSSLSHFIVGGLQVVKDDHGKISKRAVVEFIPITFRGALAGELPFETTKFLLRPGEVINCMIEWIYYRKEDNKKYAFILVGTDLTACYAQTVTNQHKLHGRMHIIQPKYKSGAIADVRLLTSYKFDKPVYSLALYESDGLFIASGTEMSFYKYSPSDWKWVMEYHQSLRSIPIAMTAKNGYLSITTVTNSHSIFKMRKSTDPTMPDDPELMFQDGIHGNGLHHVSLPVSNEKKISDPSIVNLTSYKYGQVRGFIGCPFEGNAIKHDMSLSMQLPRSIIRLCKYDVSELTKEQKSTVVGITTDGTLQGMSILSAKQWPVLKWIELLCQRSKIICPHLKALYSDRLYTDMDTEGDVDFHHDTYQLPMGLMGFGRYNNESEAEYEGRTGLDFTTFPLVDQVDVEMNDDVDEHDLDQITPPIPMSRPEVPQQPDLEKKWFIPSSERWSAKDMHVNGDILNRLIRVDYNPLPHPYNENNTIEHEDITCAEDLLKLMLEMETLQNDRVGDFIRSRLKGEQRLVDGSIAMVRSVLKSWGFW